MSSGHLKYITQLELFISLLGHFKASHYFLLTVGVDGDCSVSNNKTQNDTF